MTVSEALFFLGIKPPLTEEDIKKAFRKKAMHNHPDLAAGQQEQPDAENFIRIRQAYNLLQNTPIEQINNPQPWEPAKAQYVPVDEDRGRIVLPDWGIFKEAENLALLFLLLRKKKSQQPGRGIGFKAFRLRFSPTPLPDRASVATVFIQAWNTIKLVTASTLMALFFVLSFVLVFGIIPGLLFFTFLYRFYRTLQGQMCVKFAGPDAHLYHTDAKMRWGYLLSRILPLLLLNTTITGLLFVLATTDFYAWLKLVLGLGFCTPVLALNLSVLYELLYHVRLKWMNRD